MQTEHSVNMSPPIEAEPAQPPRETPGQTPPGDWDVVIRPTTSLSWANVADLWRYRDLATALAVRDISVRYKQAVLGAAWAIFQPVAQMLVLTLVLGRSIVSQVQLPVPYWVFCLAGLVLWNLFSVSLSHATDSLVSNSNLLTKVSFPRAIVPIASAIPAALDFSISFVLLLVVLGIAGVSVGLTALFAVPLAVLAFVCAIAIGFWTSALNMQFRDVRYALPFFLQMSVFVTPVFYPIEVVPDRFRILVLLNPMTSIIEAFRAAVCGGVFSWTRLAAATAITLALLATGFVYFKTVERTFADRA